ncbi:MAG: GNAT family N-acetyltransferase [Acidimicrobiales bacterium]
MALRILPAAPDLLAEWRAVHNEIIPAHPLSQDDVKERAVNQILSVAYDGDILIGCATVRPPKEGSPAATVIVRILPPFRRKGLGEKYLEHVLAVARARGARQIETVVLASNEDGLRFAHSHGFVERNRYILDGETIPFIDLRLVTDAPMSAD